MIRVQCADGRTRQFDLTDDELLNEWLDVQRSRREQAQLRGVHLFNGSMTAAILQPRSFRSVLYEAETIAEGERVIVQADDIRLDVLLYREQSRTRIDLRRIGKARLLAGVER